jgi:sugar-specific transcriptional regulator TrmB
MALAVDEMVQTEISPDELSRRVAVLKRFRELLTKQRDRFRDYLAALDKQKDVIENGSAEDLITHVELEEQIVADIFSIQKVINPLEDMYRSSFPEKEAEVPRLKAALEELKAEAIVRSERNKELLSKRMAEIRSEIKNLRTNPYAASRRSSYASSGTASLVDLKG